MLRQKNNANYFRLKMTFLNLLIIRMILHTQIYKVRSQP